MDDPIRPIRYAVYRDEQHSPSNADARLLLERLDQAEREISGLYGTRASLLERAERAEEALRAARPFLGMAIRPRPGETIAPSVGALVDDVLSKTANSHSRGDE